MRLKVTAIALGVATAVLLGGCASNATSNFFTDPLYIACQGKGRTTVMVGPYAGQIDSDCGDGFMYRLERGPVNVPARIPQPAR